VPHLKVRTHCFSSITILSEKSHWAGLWYAFSILKRHLSYLRDKRSSRRIDAKEVNVDSGAGHTTGLLAMTRRTLRAARALPEGKAEPRRNSVRRRHDHAAPQGLRFSGAPPVVVRSALPCSQSRCRSTRTTDG